MFIYYNMSEENFGGITPSALKKQELDLREKSWNDQHESILQQWGEAAGCYRYMNHKSFLMYKKLSMRFTLPVIILSTITGTANFAQDQFPESIRSGVPAVIGGMNLIAGIIATIMQFLKINELMENHKIAAISYGLLSRNIRLTLALPRRERSADGLDFVNTCKAEYDRLIEQSPSIPTNILKKFEKKYPFDGKFTKPEILLVRPIPKLSIKTEHPIKSLTKGGPFSKLGDILDSKDEYERQEEKLNKDEDEDEYEDGDDVELKSVASEQNPDVEQGIPKE